MRLKFVDREIEQKDVFQRIWKKTSRPRAITIDSPAGMGKTRLLFEVCRNLVRDAHERQMEWRIVWLDFRKHFSQRYSNEKDIVEEIARQICRDIKWSNVYDLIKRNDPSDQVLIREATSIPMEDTSRQALLKMIAGIPVDVRGQINHIITQALGDADIQLAKHRGNLTSIVDLIGFVLDKRRQSASPRIPDHVLVVLDGVDAITDAAGLRPWVVNELAVGLSVHNGLQAEFERFAVIVSGRFVEQDLDLKRKGRDFQEIVLQSFTDQPEFVEDLISQFKDKAFNTQDKMVNRLARKLCQVCGGHPRVIKEIASTLYDSPGHFTALDMDPKGVSYWYDRKKFRDALEEYREKAISEILEGVGEQEQYLLELLSVFRKFNSATLEFLSRKIERYRPPDYLKYFQEDIKGLYKCLQDTRLIGNDEATGPFDSDRFSLSLLSAQMREKNLDMFGLLNGWAVEMFANWIKGRFSDDPDAPLQPNRTFQRVGVCEWLFHRLHSEECCSEHSDAERLGQQISAELKEILKDILPFPFEDATEQRQRIKEDVKGDRQINHLIWEIALEDTTRHDMILNKILQAF